MTIIVCLNFDTETIILFLARHDLPVWAGCLLLGAGMAISVRNRMHARSRLFSTSLDELAKDKDQLTPR